MELPELTILGRQMRKELLGKRVSQVEVANPKCLNMSFGQFQKAVVGKTADLSNLEKLKTEIQSFLEYLEKIERGEFGPMWTKTGKEKVEEIINPYKAVYGEILSEIESTKTPETYI